MVGAHLLWRSPFSVQRVVPNIAFGIETTFGINRYRLVLSPEFAMHFLNRVLLWALPRVWQRNQLGATDNPRGRKKHKNNRDFIPLTPVANNVSLISWFVQKIFCLIRLV